MFNPPTPQGNSGSYVDLLKRMTRRVQGSAEDRIISMLQLEYENALAAENVLLARQERVRLFHQVSRAVLDEAASRIEGGKTS